MKNLAREELVRDSWFKHGCPEKMKIYVKSSGEAIRVLDGSPVTLTGEKNALFARASEAPKRELRVGQPVTLTRTCLVCKANFPSRRSSGKFCSPTCRKKYNRAQELARQQHEIMQIMARDLRRPVEVHPTVE